MFILASYRDFAVQSGTYCHKDSLFKDKVKPMQFLFLLPPCPGARAESDNKGYERNEMGGDEGELKMIKISGSRYRRMGTKAYLHSKLSGDQKKRFRQTTDTKQRTYYHF